MQMANLQVRNVPESLHRKIRRYAARQGRTIRDVVLDAIRKEIELAEFRERLEKRRPVDLGRPAARSLEDERAEREKELGA
jgi:plasmid stability protein